MRKERLIEGSISFDKQEVKFQLDEVINQLGLF
jgi:hypothetical protein